MGDGAGRDIPGSRDQCRDARRLQTHVMTPAETDEKKSELRHEQLLRFDEMEKMHVQLELQYFWNRNCQRDIFSRDDECSIQIKSRSFDSGRGTQ